jgi:hypothetical protein
MNCLIKTVSCLIKTTLRAFYFDKLCDCWWKYPALLPWGVQSQDEKLIEIAAIATTRNGADVTNVHVLTWIKIKMELYILTITVTTIYDHCSRCKIPWIRLCAYFKRRLWLTLLELEHYKSLPFRQCEG